MAYEITEKLRVAENELRSGRTYEAVKLLIQCYEMCENERSYLKETIFNLCYYPKLELLKRNYQINTQALLEDNIFGTVCNDFNEIKICPIWWELDKNEITIFAQGEFFTLKIENIESSYTEKIPYRINSFYISNTSLEKTTNRQFLYYDKKMFEILLMTQNISELLRNKYLIFLIDLTGMNKFFGSLSLDDLNTMPSTALANSQVEWERFFEYLILAELEPEYKEQITSCGELYPDKTFYVMRSRLTTSSIGAQFYVVLSGLQAAELNNAIPVIDYSLYASVYLENDELKIVNWWEYFFEQPTQYSLNMAYHSSKVILGEAVNELPYFNIHNLVYDPLIFCEAKQLFDKYIHISSRVMKKIESCISDLFQPEWKILGVTYRGTDFRNRPIPGEPRQPSIEEVIENTKNMFQEWGCDRIFLTTEDQGALDRFKSVFADQLLYFPKQRYDSNVSYTFFHHFDRENDRYLKGEEYLSEIVMVSRCQCLISSIGGMIGMVLLLNNNKYEHKFIYDLGLHTMEDYEKEENL